MQDNEAVKEDVANDAKTLRGECHFSRRFQFPYCISDIFEPSKSPSSTVPTYRCSVPSQFETILLAHYTSNPPVILPSAPPMSKDSGSEAFQNPTAASSVVKPRGDNYY